MSATGSIDLAAQLRCLTADAPLGITHTLVNGVAIHVDGGCRLRGSHPGWASCCVAEPPRPADGCTRYHRPSAIATLRVTAQPGRSIKASQPSGGGATRQYCSGTKAASRSSSR